MYFVGKCFYPYWKQITNFSSGNDDNNEKKSTANRPKLPEEPTTCCMSGCANCVWLDYAEKLTEYYRDGGERAIKEINDNITDTNIKAFLLHELRMRNKRK